jgi:hypothetical protein
MTRPTGTQWAETTATSLPPAKVEGLYLYCVADTPERTSLGWSGLEAAEVYTIPSHDLCAVVHRCPAMPYRSNDPEVVTNWVLVHQKVVEMAWDRWGTVLPFTFDTIFRSRDDAGPDQTIAEWLAAEYAKLRAQLAKVKGRAEYGVQIFWNPQLIGERLAQRNHDLAALAAAIEAKPKGTAYLQRERLRMLLRRELEEEADRRSEGFFRAILEHVDDLRVESVKKDDAGRQMILKLSCLATREQAGSLGQELERIGKETGILVRFTGPWPPYSFVGSI